MSLLALSMIVPRLSPCLTLSSPPCRSIFPSDPTVTFSEAVAIAFSSMVNKPSPSPPILIEPLLVNFEFSPRMTT